MVLVDHGREPTVSKRMKTLDSLLIGAGVLIVVGVAINTMDASKAPSISPERQAARQRLRQLDAKNDQFAWKPPTRSHQGEFCRSNSPNCNAYNTMKTACLVGVEGACTTAEEMREIYSGKDLSTDPNAFNF